MRLQIHPVFWAEELTRKVNDALRVLPIEHLSQNATRFLLHRTPMLCRPDTQPGFQPILDVPYCDAGHWSSSHRR